MFSSAYSQGMANQYNNQNQQEQLQRQRAEADGRAAQQSQEYILKNGYKLKCGNSEYVFFNKSVYLQILGSSYPYFTILGDRVATYSINQNYLKFKTSYGPQEYEIGSTRMYRKSQRGTVIEDTCKVVSRGTSNL
jgi:hypothetical protein